MQYSSTCSRDNTTDSDESSGGPSSVSSICKNIHDQLGKVARRIVVVEQPQKQLSITVKELTTLLQKQEKAIFFHQR